MDNLIKMRKGYRIYGKEYFEKGYFVSEVICSNCFMNYASLGGYNYQCKQCPFCKSYNEEVIYPLRKFSFRREMIDS